MTMITIDTLRTDLIAGDTTIGVAHQLYEITTADGRTRVAGQITASRLHVYSHGYGAEHTTFGEDEREAAVAWWQAGAPEPQPGTEEHPTVLFDDGRQRITLERAVHPAQLRRGGRS